MTELILRVAGIQSVRDGVVILLIQDKMQVPLAEEPPSDETKMVKKIVKGFASMGFAIDEMFPCPPSPNTPRSFNTAIWVTMEDYERMGKPTVGDSLSFNVEKIVEKLPVLRDTKKSTRVKTVLSMIEKLAKEDRFIEKKVLVEKLVKKKFSREEIERILLALLHEGIIYQPNEHSLSVTGTGLGG